MAEPPLLVITPWYPSEEGPYDGVFVREAIAALNRPGRDVLVIHLRNVPPDRSEPAVRFGTEEGQVLRISVPIGPGTPRVEMARAQRRALREAAPSELSRAATVHAHVGMPTGWAVAGVIPDSTRLVVTEHATYLPTILRTPVGARMYAELLERADALLTVGDKEARALRRQYPSAARKISAAGNPIRPDRFAPREHVPRSLDRWLYVGNLIPRKGVDRLIRALGAWVSARPGRPTTLSIVGDGPQRAELRGIAEELGVADRLTFLGPATPDELPGIFETSDVLLHLSSHETFGLTVVEAAMTGLPVLVTSCGGPTETLSDAAAAGLVGFVPVQPEAAVVVDALERLEHTSATADRTSVRQVLSQRYGAEAFGNRLADLLDRGEPSHEEPVAPTVLGLVLSPTAVSPTARLHQEVLRAGGRAALLTNQRGDAASADRRVATIDLHPHEARTVHHAVEGALLWTLPAGILTVARKFSGLASQIPGPQRAAASRGVNAFSRLLARHERVATGVHAKILHRYVYSWVDPDRLARYVINWRLEDVRAVSPDVILTTGPEAAPLVRRLKQHFPQALVLDTPTEATVRGVLRPADPGTDQGASR